MSSFFNTVREYGGHLIDVAEVALVHNAGQVVLKSGFNLTHLSDDDVREIKADKQAHQQSIADAEAIRQKNETDRNNAELARVQAEGIRVSNASGFDNFMTQCRLAEDGREKAELARVANENARAAASQPSA